MQYTLLHLLQVEDALTNLAFVALQLCPPS